MQKKHLVLISIFSLLLITAFFVWSGLATAQDSATETGEGPVSQTAQTSSPTTDAPQANQANMSHWFILGSHLLPRESGVGYAYGSNGCLYITNSGGAIRLQFPVTLPDGSVIKSMDIFYNDTSVSDLTVWLSTYNPGISSADVVSVSSTGSAGIGNSSSPEITHTVDNSLRAYSLNYSWGGVVSTALQICGIRINYIDPFFSAFLPIVGKN